MRYNKPLLVGRFCKALVGWGLCRATQYQTGPKLPAQTALVRDIRTLLCWFC